MYISIKEITFPAASTFEILVALEKEVLHMLALIKRVVKFPHGSDGIGLELLSPPPNYLHFVEGLRSA